MAEDNFESTKNAFLGWLHHNGFQISPKCSLTDLRGQGRGQGFVATSDFEEDEVIFKIPRSAVLNVRNATHDISLDSLSIPAAALEDMPGWLSLTTIMMSEVQRKSSRWSTYLAVLPSKLDSLVFWSPSELAELQASAVPNKIGKTDAEEIFHQKVEVLGLVDGSIELFHQMASIIMAYAFDIPQEDPRDIESEKGEELIDDEDQQTVLTMIPLADMLNADAERNNARLVCDNEDLEMRSIQKIMEGEEILNDYGLLPRSDLLRRYGYITDNYAPYDVVELSTESIVSAFRTGLLMDAETVPFKIDDADLEARAELARREAVYEDSYDISHASSEGPCLPDELIAFLYLLIIDDKILASILDSDSAIPSRSKMTTELLGMVVENLLRLREQEYATSLEDDDALLKAGISPYRKEMAVKVRRGEKAVLREAMTEAVSFQGANDRMRWTSLTREAHEEAPNPSKRIRLK